MLRGPVTTCSTTRWSRPITGTTCLRRFVNTSIAESPTRSSPSRRSTRSRDSSKASEFKSSSGSLLDRACRSPLTGPLPDEVWIALRKIGGSDGRLNSFDVFLERLLVTKIPTELVCDRRRSNRKYEQQATEGPGDCLDAPVELLGDHILATTHEQDRVEAQHGHAERRPHGVVTRPLQQMVFPSVACQPVIDCRPQEEPDERQERQYHHGYQHLRHAVAEESPADGGRQTQGPLEPPHVPIRLGGTGHRSRVERAVQPDRIDLQAGTEREQHTGDDEEQSDGTHHVCRVQAGADHVAVSPSLARELGVLLTPHDRQVHRHQADEQTGNQQHVRHEETVADLRTRKLAAEEQERKP